MELIVRDSTDTILASEGTKEAIVVERLDSVTQSTVTEAIVSHSNTEYVLVTLDQSSVVVSGLVGPPGKDGIAEEDIVYSKRIDFISDDLLYKGEAVVGSPEGNPVWRIRRVEIASDGDVTETWAEAQASFDKIWDNRLSYIYS